MRRLLSIAIASVRKGGDREQARRGDRNFEAIAVLRKTNEAPNPWKIVLVTIPQ